jgi:fructose/tagatose bisphosphate aldolase
MNAQLFIFEQAVGESLYAAQTPAEYAAGVLAAALREGHEGPVFLQGDHDQIDAKAYRKDADAEVRRLERIIRSQVDAGFYNIDIDASTVVDLALATVEDQQRLNAELTAHFTEYVRGIEPEGVTISLGAEIGEVGHENTTPEELRAFMSVYAELMRDKGRRLAGVSKISINSGTYHGGKVLPDGSLAPVEVDYALLETISRICREEFDMAGAVQHGASTLPGEQLAKFPASGAVEIHLALGFNNLIFDHPSLPATLKREIRDYTFANHAAERAPGDTDAQFLYKTRKKSWKALKKPFW